MRLSKRMLYDFSSYPVIQKAMRDYMVFGCIFDFDEFASQLHDVICELDKLKDVEPSQ